MKPANCPYIDEKCGTHSQCVKCTPQKKLIYFLKSKIETMYYRFLVDDAFRKSNAYIEEWLNDGVITRADSDELRGYNADLWWKYA